MKAVSDTLSPAEIAAVLAPLESATPPPTRVYTDASLFDAERARILRRAWRCVGREDEVASPGAWLRSPGAEPGVLVVRGADLALRAFHNVCRHRAMPLVDAPCGRARRFVCPYHGYTYELSGVLREEPPAPAACARDAGGLYPVRVETWQGFVFTCLYPEAPGLADWLGDPPPWLRDPALCTLARVHRAEYAVAANWKLVVQNFQESIHFPRVHPSLERLTRAVRARSHLGPGPWLGGIMELEERAETVSSSGLRHGRPFVGAPRRSVLDAMLFPTLLTSLQPDYLLTFRLSPLGVDHTHVVFDVLFHPAYPREDAAISDVTGFWTRINEEDRRACERQQVGLAAGVFAPTRYLDVEDGVHAFDRLFARALAG